MSQERSVLYRNEPTVKVVIPHFGPAPAWFDLFLISCRTNPSIEWLLLMENVPDVWTPDNVEIQQMSFNTYRMMVSEHLNIHYQAESPEQLNNLKPALGWVHAEQTKGFDYVGIGDLNVIYGDLRYFLTPQVLESDFVSTHSNALSSEFFLMKNTDSVLNLFRILPDWEQTFLSPGSNPPQSEAFTQCLFSLQSKKEVTIHHQEQHSTVFSTYPWINGEQKHPEVWYWKRGRVFNKFDGLRHFMYLHLKNFETNSSTEQLCWNQRNQIIHLDTYRTSKILERGFRIDRKGFHLRS